MTDDECELEMRAILGEDWKAPVDVKAAERFFALSGKAVDDEAGPYIGRAPAGWLICGSYAGQDYAGCREDGISLAHDWVAMVRQREPSRPENFIEAMVGNYAPIPTPPIQDIRQAYEESHADDGDAGAVDTDPADPDLGGDPGEFVEAGANADPGEPADYSAEPVGDDPELAWAGAYPGVMVQGDPLKAAKNDAREALAQMQRSILDRYPWQDNLRDFDQMQSVRWAIAEGTHPPFNEEQQAEFDALSTFSNWFGRVNQNAFNITIQIDDAETVEAVNAININSGWPE